MIFDHFALSHICDNCPERVKAYTAWKQWRMLKGTELYQVSTKFINNYYTILSCENACRHSIAPVSNMATYCTSMLRSFPEPKVRENTAHECNVSLYWTLTQAMRDLLHTSLCTVACPTINYGHIRGMF